VPEFQWSKHRPDAWILVLSSGVSLDHAAAQLLIRLQLTDPQARVYCVTQPRGEEDSRSVAEALVAALRASGTPARVVTSFAETASNPGTVMLDMPQAREELRSTGELTVVAAGNVLESRRSLTAAVAADLLVLVARRRRTRRADVDDAREVLLAAGARLAAALLID
jgi:hypothetical protein